MQLQPKVFLINLDKSPHRLQKSSEQLASQNIEFERIQAIDGTQLSQNEIAKHYSPELNKATYYRNLGYGEIGCYLSHRLAWQKIVENKLPYAIVLEDDFQLTGKLLDVFNAINTLQEEWHLLKLANYQKRNKPIKARKPINGNFELVIHKKPLTGCCAQAITLQAATQLLKVTERFGCPVDTQIQRVWQTNVPVFALMPFVIEQDDKTHSDISNACKGQSIIKHPLKRKVQQLSDAINHAKVNRKIINEF